jgi:hypothetical protein
MKRSEDVEWYRHCRKYEGSKDEVVRHMIRGNAVRTDRRYGMKRSEEVGW